jgi:cytochrome P450
MDELYWDPFDEEIDTHPHPTWRRMRDAAPVYRNDRHDFWALSRYADVEAAHRDPATFSSAHGTVLEIMGPHMRSTGQIIFLDPPEHTTLRKLVSRAFTPRRVAQLEDEIRRICGTLLDAQADEPEFDYLQDFGARLPSMVISTLLGVPPADQERMRHVIDQVFHIEPGVGMINDVSATASIEVTTFLRHLIRRRQQEPRDDMLTGLAHAEITENGEPRRLTLDEAASFGILLFVAGTETVARLLGWTAVVLDRYPDQRQQLADDQSLIPGAVEELLRFEAPSPVQGRWTTADVDLHGVTIPAGSKVLLLTGSAGRDDRVYDDPDRFDIHREPRPHLSFGYGIHFCLGAALARMEGRVALEETLKRFPTWTVDHDRSTRLHTSTVRGYATVKVRT